MYNTNSLSYIIIHIILTHRRVLLKIWQNLKKKKKHTKLTKTPENRSCLEVQWFG